MSRSKTERNRIMQVMRTGGVPVRDIAEEFDLSVSAVYQLTRNPGKYIMGKPRRKQPLSDWAQKRKEEMTELRRKGWTKTAIGEKYGISRERVRQILGNDGRVAAKKVRELRAGIAASVPATMTNTEAVDAFGFDERDVEKARRGVPHRPESGSVAVGFDAEIFVCNELRARGRVVEKMPFRHPYDILVDGKVRVDVKYCGIESSPPSLYPPADGVRLKFNIGGARKRSQTDVFVCVSSLVDVAFVIPAEDMIKSPQLVITYPNKWNKNPKYDKYVNRWDLI